MNLSEENLEFNKKLEKYKLKDAKIQIIKLIKNYIYSEGWESGNSIKFLLNLSKINNLYFYIIKLGEIPISFLVLNKEKLKYKLLFLYTMKKFRRKGFATELLNNVKNFYYNKIIIHSSNIPPLDLFLKEKNFSIDEFFKKFANKIDEENYYI